MRPPVPGLKPPKLYTKYTFSFYKLNCRQVQVAHTCNPIYSGGRDQEDHSLKPANSGQIVCKILSQKNPSRKRAGGVAQGVGPEFKLQYSKKKKKKKKKS
jgi:hypothetical protein